MKQNERSFEVRFIVGEKRLGTILADLGNVPGLNVSLIEPRDASKNLPRGSFTNRFVGLIEEAGGAMPRNELRLKMLECGYPKTTFHTTVTRLLEQKKIYTTKKGNEVIIHLKK